MRPPILSVAVAAFLLAAACGTDPSSSGAGDADGATTPVVPTTTSPPVYGPSAVITKPTVTVPDGAPPATLQITDITVGTGAEAVAGSTVLVQYVGVSWSTKVEFDASWGGQPLTFVIGSGQVIPGWDQGVAGMRVGGRRELVIPPDLAYGAEGRLPDIVPNETLVFVIDLVVVE